MKPSNFTSHPWGSVKRSCEHEVIASNIMKILKRTGDSWRKLSFDEYKNERLKDGNFAEWKEKSIFEEVVGYTTSQEDAVKFCKNWASGNE